MRFFFYIVSTALAAGPTDLCTQLCDRDGPLVCTGGSWTKPDGTCQAYLFRGDPSLNDPCYHTRTTATSCPAGGQPVRASDVSRLLSVGTILAPSAPSPVVTTTVSPTDDEAYQIESARASEFILRRACHREINAYMMIRTVANMDVEFRDAFYRAGLRAETDPEWGALNFFLRNVDSALINGLDLSAARTRAMDYFLTVGEGDSLTFRPARVTTATVAPTTTRLPETTIGSTRSPTDPFWADLDRATEFVHRRAGHREIDSFGMIRTVASMDVEFQSAFYRAGSLAESDPDWGALNFFLRNVGSALTSGADCSTARSRAMAYFLRIEERANPTVHT